MELLYLKTFCALVKWGTYTRTALELDYAQSSITNHIQRLESIYGGQRLLIRSGNQVVPTAAGERLLPYARQMLELQQAAHQTVQGQEEATATLTIGTIESLSTYVLPRLLELFHAEHPDYKVRIILASESELLLQLREGKIDLAFILDTPMREEGLTTAIGFAVDMKVLLPEEHPLHTYHGIQAADLHGHPLILTEEGCTYRSYLLQTMQEATVTADIRWEMAGVDAIRQAVSKRWGIGFLPSYVVEGMGLTQGQSTEGIHVLPWTQPHMNLYVQFMYESQPKKIVEEWVQLSHIQWSI